MAASPAAGWVARLPPPPEGALVATNAELPAVLRRFDARPVLLRLAGAGAKGGPEIAFPVDGSTIALPHQGQALKSLPLNADGGVLPLLWLVNGKRIDSTPFRREAEWQPDGPGEVRITVIDSAGRVASSEVWVQ